MCNYIISKLIYPIHVVKFIAIATNRKISQYYQETHYLYAVNGFSFSLLTEVAFFEVRFSTL